MRRLFLLNLGLAFLVAGIALLPVPLPLELPFLVIGTALVLKSSQSAKRRYLGWSRRHPRLFRPLNRVLRRRRPVAAHSLGMRLPQRSTL